MRPVVAVLQTQPVPVHRRVEVAVVRHVDADRGALPFLRAHQLARDHYAETRVLR